MLFFGAIGGTFCAKGKFAEGFLIADPHRAKAAQREHIDNAKALKPRPFALAFVVAEIKYPHQRGIGRAVARNSIAKFNKQPPAAADRLAKASYLCRIRKATYGRAAGSRR